jgi:hypothetical protein
MNRPRFLQHLGLCLAVTALTGVAAEHFHSSEKAKCDTCQLMTDFTPEPIVEQIDKKTLPQTYTVPAVSDARALVIRQLSRDPPTPV